MGEPKSHEDMIRLAARLIKRDYRTNRRYCMVHGIDQGNLSKALNNKGVLTDEMLEPLGFQKRYIPVYERIPKGDKG